MLLEPATAVTYPSNTMEIVTFQTRVCCTNSAWGDVNRNIFIPQMGHQSGPSDNRVPLESSLEDQ